MIVITSNEPDSIKHLDWHQAPHIQLLVTGDIMLIEGGKVMLIERKAAPDLLNSLADGRLMEQCSRLVEECHYPLLLIHGSLLMNKAGKIVADGRHSRHDWWSLQMALVSLQAGGVMVMHLKAVRDIPDAVKYLAGWLGKKSHLHVSKREKLPFLTPGKDKKPLEILASLPGIGMVKAPLLLKHYRDAGWALADLTNARGKWPLGIGIGTVRRFRKALGLNEGYRLQVVSEEEDV